MPFEIFRKYDDNRYGKGVLLNEWNGGYFFIAANERNGVVYKRWGYPSTKKKEPGDQVLPWQVKLGDTKQEAIAMLKWALEQLVEDAPF